MNKEKMKNKRRARKERHNNFSFIDHELEYYFQQLKEDKDMNINTKHKF